MSSEKDWSPLSLFLLIFGYSLGAACLVFWLAFLTIAYLTHFLGKSEEKDRDDDEDGNWREGSRLADSLRRFICQP